MIKSLSQPVTCVSKVGFGSKRWRSTAKREAQKSRTVAQLQKARRAKIQCRQEAVSLLERYTVELPLRQRCNLNISKWLILVLVKVPSVAKVKMLQLP